MIYYKSLNDYYANTHIHTKWYVYMLYKNIMYMCLLLYHHSEKLKVSLFIGDWLNKSYTI